VAGSGVPAIGVALGLPSMGGLDVGSGPFKLSAEEDAAIRAAAGGDPAKAALMRAILAAENRGKPGPDNLAVSPRGATGAFQFMPGTWGQFGEGAFRRAYDFDTSARAASRFIDWIKKTYNTDDPAVIAAYYNGGDRAARAVLAGEAPPAKETADYVNMVTGNLSTPLPAGDPAGKAERERAANITVGFTPADVMIRSAEDRRLLGTATLQPKALPAPAGAH
jgi:soluble lytic murein transglycosylase-like protein